jgi:membrane protease YdiL (CAAX protease family)
LVLLWAWRSHTPWGEIGYVRPRNWIRTAVIAFALGVAFKLVMKAVVMPMLGADPINQRYHYLAGNTAELIPMIFVVVIGAGFGEETFFRGYLFERLGKLIGSSAAAKTLIVLVTATWFALVHYPEQGLAGVQQAMITGLAFGTIFAITGSLFPLMIAHAAFDLIALAIIYWDLETAVAHSIFR